MLILAFTAFLKILTLVTASKEMVASDPLFYFLENRHLLAGAVILEIVAVIALMMSRNFDFQLKCIAWLATLFFAYHLGLKMIGYEGGCFCLGKPQSWLTFLKPLKIDVAVKILVIYMIVGSYGLILYYRLKFNNSIQQA